MSLCLCVYVSMCLCASESLRICVSVPLCLCVSGTCVARAIEDNLLRDPTRSREEGQVSDGDLIGRIGVCDSDDERALQARG